MFGDKERERRREEMVSRQVEARGITSPAVLVALRRVRREAFVPADVTEWAYDDTPLPIGEGQTISQPYIVAKMIEAAGLTGGERVLEVGTGSGYAAAVLAEIAAEVFTIERREALAERARKALNDEGYGNVHVRSGDGTRGWPEEAPFHAILVAAGGPRVPESLQRQLTLGGRMVLPVGEERTLQRLVRITRTSENAFARETLEDVRFVPLIGAEGWQDEPSSGKDGSGSGRASTRAGARNDRGGTSGARGEGALRALLHRRARPIDGTLPENAAVDVLDLDALLERIGDARVVLLGEATHGTHEFYAYRARLTQALVERKGFSIVAVEADWPDAAGVDRRVRGLPEREGDADAFQRFPTWMWRNEETAALLRGLRAWNDGRSPERRVRFAGLDLYAMFRSIAETLRYLDQVDPAAARIARERYGCLAPWQADPVAYGRAASADPTRSCEDDVVALLRGRFHRALGRGPTTGADALPADEGFFDARQNARLVASAEAYYRALFRGAAASWNLRDDHMFRTLLDLMRFHGARSGGEGGLAKAVVWAHNSHVGDSAATEMADRGEQNLGRLCRAHFGDAAYVLGFGTDHGSVAAATVWDGPMEVKRVRPALEGSHEALCRDVGTPAFVLPLRGDPKLQNALSARRLERAIGVIYRPETERQSHYFHAVLPQQFDEWVFFDETRAITPLAPTARP